MEKKIIITYSDATGFEMQIKKQNLNHQELYGALLMAAEAVRTASSICHVSTIEPDKTLEQRMEQLKAVQIKAVFSKRIACALLFHQSYPQNLHDLYHIPTIDLERLRNLGWKGIKTIQEYYLQKYDLIKK